MHLNSLAALRLGMAVLKKIFNEFQRHIQKPNQTCKMERFAKIVNRFEAITFFAKRSDLNV